MFDEVLLYVAGGLVQEDCCHKIIKVAIDVSNNMISVWYNGIVTYSYEADNNNNMFTTEFTRQWSAWGRNYKVYSCIYVYVNFGIGI